MSAFKIFIIAVCLGLHTAAAREADRIPFGLALGVDLTPYYPTVNRHDDVDFSCADFPAGLFFHFYPRNSFQPFTSVSLHRVTPNQTMEVTGTSVQLTFLYEPCLHWD